MLNGALQITIINVIPRMTVEVVVVLPVEEIQMIFRGFRNFRQIVFELPRKNS